LAAITGLAAVFHASSLAFDILKYLGVAYLLYMARNTLKDRGAFKIDDSLVQSPVKMIHEAVLINLLNPKLPIFFFAFLPQFISTHDSTPLRRMIELSGVFMIMTFVVFTAYGAFAAFMRSHVLARPRVLTWIRRAFAVGFLGLGAKLAFSQR
jgi:threonine/homoserine/homoserine lactone efflux protein